MSEQEKRTFADQIASLEKLLSTVKFVLGAFAALVMAIFALGADYNELRSNVAQAKADRETMTTRIEILQKQRIEDQRDLAQWQSAIKDKVIETRKDVEWIRDTLGGRRGR
jgi:predicted  nucleic acid-binding Zn-ribbon protein